MKALYQINEKVQGMKNISEMIFSESQWNFIQRLSTDITKIEEDYSIVTAGYVVWNLYNASSNPVGLLNTPIFLLQQKTNIIDNISNPFNKSSMEIVLNSIPFLVKANNVGVGVAVAGTMIMQSKDSFNKAIGDFILKSNGFANSTGIMKLIETSKTVMSAKKLLSFNITNDPQDTNQLVDANETVSQNYKILDSIEPSNHLYLHQSDLYAQLIAIMEEL